MVRWRSHWGRRQEAGKVEVLRQEAGKVEVGDNTGQFCRLWASPSTLTYVPNL